MRDDYLSLYLDPRTGIKYAVEATLERSTEYESDGSQRSVRVPGVLRMFPVGPGALEAKSLSWLHIGEIDREAVDVER